MPDGILSSGHGLSANLEVGASQTTGNRTPRGFLGARGGFAYAPSWQSLLLFEVQSTQPADSMVLSRSRLGGAINIFNRAKGEPLGILTSELAWWSQTFHLDTGSTAIEIVHSGLETHLGMGIGGIGTKTCQGAIGTSAGIRVALAGPEQARPEFLWRAQGTFHLSLQEFMNRNSKFSQGLGLYLKIPVQWSPFPLDPAAGTGRPFALPRWEYGVRLGFTALL
jgi:hypothetical protein